MCVGVWVCVVMFFAGCDCLDCTTQQPVLCLKMGERVGGWVGGWAIFQVITGV